ncbi:hypothetical protein EV191_103152 [Tamaricihabitans halophyticus]|uniref:Uncharacterized protein n=1 Tax=Tamaricihabitans halophyticus TaxID=1262583 RepID=A0A4R2R3L1_9PSEU|nr:hypothetical protein [Tamaricihabitans halophyticus]TCP54111.1 hypothetical protein EV191_103152 [Tamaricihabitans halophyticus]
MLLALSKEAADYAQLPKAHQTALKVASLIPGLRTCHRLIRLRF